MERNPRLNLEKRTGGNLERACKLSISLQETGFLCNNPTHDPRSPGDRRRKTPISTSRGAELAAPKGSKTGQGRGSGAGGGSSPPPAPRSLTSAGLTGAPLAGTSPRPREQEVGRGLPLTPATPTPHPSALGPRSSPPSPLSLPRRPASPRRTKLPSSVLCPSEARSCQPGGVPSQRPSEPPRSSRPSEVSFHNFPPTHQKPPSSPAHPASTRVVRPGHRAGGATPPFTPFTCFSGSGPTGLGALAPGYGPRAPSGRRVSPSGRGEGEPSRVTRQGFGAGSLPPLRRRNPKFSLPVAAAAAAAPETSELQPLQPIPAQPHPDRDTPSCIIHETASPLLRWSVYCPPTDQ